MLRVAVVDDHALVRAGLVSLLSGAPDIAVVAEAADGAGALEAVAATDPDVVVLDVSLGPGIDGIEVCRRLRAAGAPTRVLLLTATVERDVLDRALGAGASGLVLKEAEPAEFVRAVRATAQGDRPLDPKAARLLLDGPPITRPTDGGGVGPLTTRQAEVLGLVANGCSNKQIARIMGISEKTVKAHLTTIFQLIGAADRTAAAVWLVKRQPGDA